MSIAIRYFTRSKKGNTRKLADVVSKALGIEALDVSSDLEEKVGRLFLINAMYAADIDREVKDFLQRNRDRIGEVVNMNTSASGSSTLKAVKRVTDELGIKLSEREFHCAASWIFINKGLPAPEDFKSAGEFACSMVPKDDHAEKAKEMTIKAVKFRKDGFYSQPFAFGGEDGPEKYDPEIRYRGSLQNYLIDTGDEVILVDTGLPAGTPEENPDETSVAFTGKDICTYMEAFAALGYRPEQVTKILLTHKHADHSGELRSFPNAKIYVNSDELSAAELQGIPNLVPVGFTDGAFYNFPESQKIRDGITFIKAKGHTNGNSIVIVESGGLFYMIHGDITYVDEALYENKLSVVFEDLPAARETLDRIREFIRDHKTVYMGTHTPQGYENLEAKRVMDLDDPVPTVLAEVEFSKKEASGKYVCSVCGYVYDPAEHDGVAFEDLPDDWKCPRCRQSKEKFSKA